MKKYKKKHKNKKIIIVRNKNIKRNKKQEESLLQDKILEENIEQEIEEVEKIDQEVREETIEQEIVEQEIEPEIKDSGKKFRELYVLTEEDKISIDKKVQNFIRRRDAEQAELERKQDYLNAINKFEQKEQEEK